MEGNKTIEAWYCEKCGYGKRCILKDHGQYWKKIKLIRVDDVKWFEKRIRIWFCEEGTVHDTYVCKSCFRIKHEFKKLEGGKV